MVTRLSVDARRQILTSAADEARRRGDRRIGTDHLLLGLLYNPDSLAARELGIDLEAARVASVGLDRAALAAVGVDVGHLDPRLPMQSRRRPPFTSGARAVLERSLHEALSAKARRVDERHLLLALLSRERPDPVAELLTALGVDAAEVRDRLKRSAS